MTYVVYFGTSSSPPLVSTNQIGTTYAPSTLNYNTKYYWKIVATDNHGESTTGPLWNFTTAKAPQEQEMHINSIDMELKSGRSWIFQYIYAMATVDVVDSQGYPAKGVIVSGHWSGATTDNDSGITNSNGEVIFSSDSIRRAAKRTKSTFTIDNVSKSGWIYNSDANIESSNSITINPSSWGGFFDNILTLVKQFIQKVREIFSQAIGC